MKQRLMFCIIVFLCSISSAFSQTYRNEWIDYSKTYYRFTVVKDGVYRINTAELPAAIQNTPAQNFQLWRNGVQIPIYTSVATGVLGSGDYIEFWGKMNTGYQDSVMYLDPSFQTNKVVSMETDSSTYFLTVNSTSTNSRLTATTNTISGSPTPMAYFIDSLTYGFRDILWQGYAQVISGEYVLSSSYDKNEGWTSNKTTNTSFVMSSLKAYTQAGAPNMQFTYAGGAENIFYNSGSTSNPSYNTTDVLTTTFNGSQIDQRTISSLDTFILKSQTFPVSTVSSNDDITVNVSTQNGSVFMLGSYKLVYPRKFDFGGAQSFAFDLPANASGNYLEISNFNAGTSAPILIDITNGKRYTCTYDGTLVKVKMSATTAVSKCVLYTGDASFATHISSYTTRNFVDYSLAANQSDFILIANSLLNSGTNNQVEAYRAYRSSAAGGSYNSKVYDVDLLTDEFGYGVYKHPLAMRNFIQYANNKFTVHPKYVLILGHGVNFNDFYGHQGTTNGNILNMVPTWGNPASDVLLSAASLKNPIPAIPIGRVSVINNTELKAYLDKVKEFDLLKANTTNNQASKDWTKKALFLIGSGSDVNALLASYMKTYATIIKDTLVGADAPLYGENGTNLTQATTAVKNIINNGVPLLTYFGHASLTALDFNISDPNDYTNTGGKYPIFSVGGCNAGNFYNYDESRITNSIYTISEKFTLAPARGALGFLSSTHFGVVNTLDYYNTQFFIATNGSSYGKSIGLINQKAFDTTWQLFNGDYFTRLTLEQTTLHGDPSITLYTAPKPDYDMETQNITISPSFVSVADDSFKVSISVHNLGKAINNPVKVKLQWKDPTGKTKDIGTYQINGVHYIDSSITATLHIVGNTQQGTNYIIATLDPDNVINEVDETNNTATLSFQISPDEIRPVYPYPLSIVNTPTFKLIASTVDPFQASRTYQVDMDTTELFNSALLASKQVTQVGGEVEFTPPITNLVNNKVYYWRVAPIVGGVPVNYRKSSFLYNTTFGSGWSQSHLYQHLKSSTAELSIDSTSGQLNFGKISNSLQVNNAYYFNDHISGGIQDIDFETLINGNPSIGKDCYSFSMTFYVFDTTRFQPWSNPSGGLYGSNANCGGKSIYNFTFDYYTTDGDNKIMNFMDAIPNGYYVVIKPQFPAYTFDPSLYHYVYTPEVYARDMAAFNTPGRTVPDYLKAQGFTDIDQFTYPRLWTFIYKKNDQAHFLPQFTFSQSLYDKIVTSAECFSTDSIGTLTSPVFGPAKAWSQVHWKGHSLETVAPFPDSAILQVIAIDKNGVSTVKYNLDRTNLDFDISSISAAIYPYIQLKLVTKDAVNATPWQLDSWRLDYTPAPEGVLAPNLYSYAQTSTTSAANQPYKFGVAFKNVGSMPMNALKLKLTLTDSIGNQRSIALPNTKSLVAGDTTNIYFEIPTDTLHGTYNIFLDVNSDSAQTEQYFFNNFLYKQFTVNTPLPVTFLNFQATPNASNVSLQWQVSTEAGANYYVVERSSDGVNFSTIGKVAALKNNALMNTYNYVDANPIAGKNYYRIRILNQDGTSEFSEIRVVTFGKDNQIRIYPNPVKNVLNVSVPSDGKAITLTMTSATGQKIMQTTTLGSTQLNMGQYAAGIYYLQVKDAAGISSTFRVEKQ